MGIGTGKRGIANNYLKYEGVPDRELTAEDMKPFSRMELENGELTDANRLQEELDEFRNISLSDWDDWDGLVQNLGFTSYMSDVQKKMSRFDLSQYISGLNSETGNDINFYDLSTPAKQRALASLDAFYRMSELTGIKPDAYLLREGKDTGEGAWSTPTFTFKKTKTPGIDSNFSPQLVILLRGTLSSRSARGWSVPGTLRNDAQLAIVHEFGHLFLDKVINDAVTKGSASALNRLVDYANKTKSMKSLTMYGNENHNEAFAENFTAYVMGVRKPSEGVKQYTEFKIFMNDIGASHLYNSFSTASNAISQIKDYASPKFTSKTTTQVSKPVSVQVSKPIPTSPKVSKPAPTPTSTATKVTPTQQSTVTVKIKGKGSYTFALDSTDISRGFTIKEIDGKTYRVYVDGKYSSW